MTTTPSPTATPADGRFGPLTAICQHTAETATESGFTLRVLDDTGRTLLREQLPDHTAMPHTQAGTRLADHGYTVTALTGPGRTGEWLPLGWTPGVWTAPVTRTGQGTGR